MVGISEGMSVVSVGITVSNMISVLTVSISSSLGLGWGRCLKVTLQTCVPENFH